MEQRLRRSTTILCIKMRQGFLSEVFINRTLYDAMNDVLGNALTMTDEFHRAVYFLTTLKLGQWHYRRVGFTK